MKKHDARIKRKVRIRKKISGCPERPRLVVYRSNLHIYAQLVDDLAGKTLAATSTLSLGKSDSGIHPNIDGAAKVGREIARIAKENNIASVTFDRNGYLYHGRIKAVAEGAREGGLEF